MSCGLRGMKRTSSDPKELKDGEGEWLVADDEDSEEPDECASQFEFDSASVAACRSRLVKGEYFRRHSESNTLALSRLVIELSSGMVAGLEALGGFLLDALRLYESFRLSISQAVKYDRQGTGITSQTSGEFSERVNSLIWTIKT